MNLVVTTVSIIFTIIVYLLSRLIARRNPSPFTTPVFLSTTIIIILLLITGITYEQYEPAKDIMTYMLGPATVALAVPMYKNRLYLVKYWVPVLLGLVSGSIATIAISILLAKLFGISNTLLSSLAVKSATVPIAIEVASIVNGNVSLAAVFVMITGILGAMLGPWFLTITKVHNPIARGLAIGTISHGIGTAEIAREGELQGAVAGTAMALAAVFISIFVPIIFFLF